MLLFVLYGLVFLASNFKEEATKTAGNKIVESIAQHVENNIFTLKTLSSGAQSVNITFSIPDRIGEQLYLISAKNNTRFDIRTFGNPSLIEERNVTFWNVTLEGAAFSSKGKVTLVFVPSENTVTFK